MSIRLRLLIMCVIAAILPAVPITYLVRDLLDKSFDVGLSSTVSEALESGMSVSRKHLVRLQVEFEQDIQDVIARIPATYVDSSRVSDIVKQYTGEHGSIGYFVASYGHSTDSESRADSIPRVLERFSSQPAFLALISSRRVSPRPAHARDRGPLSHFETEDKAVQLALWQPSGADDGGLLFYREIDPEFIGSAQRLVHGRQIFAQLRLSHGALSHSFFYPFIIVYGVILLLALLLALFMAERMATPVRNLAEASEAVAGGNWQVQLRRTIGGEIGRLIDAFNLMVSRLDSQRRRLLDMEKVMGWREMARHLAHEIKNPLLPIRLAVQEMRDQYRGDDKAYSEFLDESTRVVEDELGHLQRLVREFSMFAKLPGLAPTTGSLERLLSDLAKLYPQVETHISADPSIPEFPFDADQMRRVFVNLFDNARNVARIEKETKISIELKCSYSDAVIVFSDNGPGIPAENINRIFDPYFTTRRTGTGLGLALVKSIVLMHQGTIYVESPPGRGAVFTIVLPLGGPDSSERPREER